MSPPVSILSRTLQSITVTKIRELAKQREKYEGQKKAIIEEAEASDSKRKLVLRLLIGVNELYPASPSDTTLSNISRWIDQSRYDATIPDHMIQKFEDQLRGRLDIQTTKLDLADLYSRLLTEWMSPKAAAQEVVVGTDDTYEIVERQKERLQQLCDTFESVVFEPLETDEVEIDRYLRALFSSDDAEKALDRLRKVVGSYSKTLIRRKSPFDEGVLTWCIKGLLVEDLLSDEKQKTLQDFLENELVLGEIADVLNMRFADIKSWSWDVGAEGIPVMPRQQLNGKYRIWMDEDVLQAIFIHYIGIMWSIELKSALIHLTHDQSVWKGHHTKTLSSEESDKWRYQVGLDSIPYTNVDILRRNSYRASFCLSSLPGSVRNSLAGGGYDNDEQEEGNDKASPIRQQLLRTIATEVLLHQSLHGEVAVVQSDMKWYATGLSHTTIFAIMRFVGFSEDWISFYKKFLEAPLNMSPSKGDGTFDGTVRTRRRGIPMAHSPEKLLGELVLFMMDIAVNKEAGMLLYRLHDDLWLCGEPERCAKAWTTMKTFASITGLEFNYHKTGSVYFTSGRTKDSKIVATLPNGPVCIGFLVLNPESGTWTIDQKQVTEHVTQLKKQLAGCDSVLSWVQTWNSCIGRFFSHTFGEPAHCFGRQHVDSILETHEAIQETLFDGKNNNGKNVIEHLKNMISSRFGFSAVPDAFLYTPEPLGGLGLRNPFVPFFLVRKQLDRDPLTTMIKFLKEEKETYASSKKVFEELTEQQKRRRLRDIYPDEPATDDAAILAKWQTFMSFEEFIQSRETTSFNLASAYVHLSTVPPNSELELSSEVRQELRILEKKIPEVSLDAEKRWIVQLHSAELFTKCGGLTVVDKSYLPLGVLTMMRKKKVTWQMVL